MATEGTYTELASGWQLTRRAEGITAVRVFHDADSSATDSLPDIGDLFDPLDESLEELRAIEITKTLYGGMPGQYLYTIQYTTAPGSTDAAGDTDEAVDPAVLPVSGSMAGDAVTINTSSSASPWVWEDDQNVKVTSQLFKKIISGSIKIVRRTSSLELSTWAALNGTVNNADLDLAGVVFTAGCVLFNGVEYEEYRNDHGKRRWKVTFNFSIKLQDDPDAENYLGWNYIYDDKTSSFRRPYNTDGVWEDDYYLYSEEDLSVLLSPPTQT